MRVAFWAWESWTADGVHNLVKAGHEVFRLEPDRRQGRRRGAERSFPCRGGAGREVVWMCVSDTNAVEGVLFGPQGVEEALAEGMTIVDSSTISPSATRQLPRS